MLGNQDTQAPEPQEQAQPEARKKSIFSPRVITKRQRIEALEARLNDLENVLIQRMAQQDNNTRLIQADINNLVQLTVGEGLISPENGQINSSLKSQIACLLEALGYEFEVTPVEVKPSELNIKKVKKGKK